MNIPIHDLFNDSTISVRVSRNDFIFFIVRLVSVLRGHSFFSSPPQRPMTSDFEGFSIPDYSFMNGVLFKWPKEYIVIVCELPVNIDEIVICGNFKCVMYVSVNIVLILDEFEPPVIQASCYIGYSLHLFTFTTPTISYMVCIHLHNTQLMLTIYSLVLIKHVYMYFKCQY